MKRSARTRSSFNLKFQFFSFLFLLVTRIYTWTRGGKNVMPEEIRKWKIITCELRVSDKLRVGERTRKV